MIIPEKIVQGYINFRNIFSKFELIRESGQYLLKVNGRRTAFILSEDNMYDIIQENTISKGIITQQLIALQDTDGSYYFCNK